MNPNGVQGRTLLFGGYGFSSVQTFTITAVEHAVVRNGVIIILVLVIIKSCYGSARSRCKYCIIGGVKEYNKYCLTDEFKVYKCVDSKNNAVSANIHQLVTEECMPVLQSIRSYF